LRRLEEINLTTAQYSSQIGREAEQWQNRDRQNLLAQDEKMFHVQEIILSR
jgi:hypothetical protein